MSQDLQHQAAQYNALVQQYHALDERIDELLEAHEGHSDNMTDAARAQYRTMAHQRDELLNAMWALELELFPDSDQ